MGRKRIDIPAGTEITNACLLAASRANTENCDVMFEFNGTLITISPGEDYIDVLHRWYTARRNGKQELLSDLFSLRERCEKAEAELSALRVENDKAQNVIVALMDSDNANNRRAESFREERDEARRSYCLQTAALCLLEKKDSVSSRFELAHKVAVASYTTAVADVLFPGVKT